MKRKSGIKRKKPIDLFYQNAIDSNIIDNSEEMKLLYNRLWALCPSKKNT